MPVWLIVGGVIVFAAVVLKTLPDKWGGLKLPSQPMFARFDEKAMDAIKLAQEESHRHGHNWVSTEQILLGLISQRTGVAANILAKKGVNLNDARAEVEKIIGRGHGFVASEIPFTPRAVRALALSLSEADKMHAEVITTEHLLLGLIQGDGIASRVLQNLGVDLNELEGAIKQWQGESDNND